MFCVEDIIEYTNSYGVENGKVYSKKDNIKIIDDDIPLRVKAAKLIYNEAKIRYLEDKKQFGNNNQSFNKYIEKMMEKLSVHDENNSYGVNKLIRSLLSSNGHYEEMMSGNDLSNSKFSIFCGQKKEYGLAYLKLKFRERGYDVSNLAIKLDTSQLQKNGVSKVSIDYDIRNYTKGYQHPKATILNELENSKRNAKNDDDKVAYRFAQTNIERIVNENEISVTPEQWSKMTREQKTSFMILKMKEAKALKDKSLYDYWQMNLMMHNQTSDKPLTGNKKK